MHGIHWLWVASDVATVLTGIAVLGAVGSFWQGRRHRLQDFDQRFVDRYWDLHDSKVVTQGRGGRLKIEVSDQVKYAELMLCEDELDARRDGLVTDKSWGQWESSIRSHASDEHSQKVLDALPADQLTHLREFLAKDGVNDDPLTLGKFRRRWRGL